MRAIWHGTTIAWSDDTTLVEGNQYFPPGSVDRTILRPSHVKSLCPWKGVASYYHVEIGGERSANAAWTYRHPYPWIRKIRNRIAFGNDVDVVAD
jgi:uncharacterized protein (DUF427 family)